jgi:uncharacterized membrane protein YphA (DoxX/SURF4 family)
LQGLQGLQGFFAAQGLHGLHGFFAAQGLQGLQALTLQGLQAPQALVAQGLHPAATWIEVSAALDMAVGKATAPVARVATLSAITVFLIIYASKVSKPDKPAVLTPGPAGSLMNLSEGPGTAEIE